MILADTSLWIEHLRRGHHGLSLALNRGEVLGHPLVIGEIACGSLKDREVLLGLLDSLPRAVECSHDEARKLIEGAGLFSAGIGIVDVHLLASVRLSRASLWTLDRRLRANAQRLQVAHTT